MYEINKNQKVQCCGIVGVVSKKEGGETFLLEGMKLLENRGYDSAGISTIRKNEKNFKVTKIASCNQPKIDCIEKIQQTGPLFHKGAIAGLGHTRWATCGVKSDANAHPHFNMKKNLCLVHNGTLDNYDELKNYLLNKNYELKSETDSELIVHIISDYMENKNLQLREAVSQVIKDQKIKGQWGLVALEKENPNQMVVARRGNPILVGLSQNSIYVSSEKLAFEQYANEYIELKEEEVLLLDVNKTEELKNQKREEILTIQNKQQISLKPQSQFKSFFEQEIFEQSSSVLKLLNQGKFFSTAQRDTCHLEHVKTDQCSKLSQIDSMVAVACGSSHYATLFSQYFFKKLQCFNSFQCILGSDLEEDDIPKKNAGMIVVSQSGETADLRNGVSLARKHGLLTVGIVNVEESQIDRQVDCRIHLKSGREVAVAATKSFTHQVLALIILSVYVSKAKQINNAEIKEFREGLIRNLKVFPVLIGSTLAQIGESCKEAAIKIKDKKSLICLGKGPGSAIAKEGALKLKELTYIHAEGFSTGELKHGPLALINSDEEKSTVVFHIILDDSYLEDSNTCLSEVHSRGAYNIVITDCREKIMDGKADQIIEIQNAGLLTALLCILPFQLITSEVCQLLGINPDKPRNLAKTVTTK